MFGLGIYAYVALAGIIVVAAGAFWWRAHRSGERKAENRQMRDTLETKEKMDEAAARAPRDRSGVSRKLRRGNF